MGTFENIVVVLSSIGIGLFIGYMIAKSRMKDKEKTEKIEPDSLKTKRNQTDISERENCPTSSEEPIIELSEKEKKERQKVKTTELIKEILKNSERNKCSFFRSFIDVNIPDNIAIHDIVEGILKQKDFIYFDEFIDVIRNDYHQIFIRNNVSVRKREGTYLSQADIIYAKTNINLKYIFFLIKDENFENGNSLEVIQNLEKEYSLDYFLVEYFCEGDGQKHWRNPDAENLLIASLIEIASQKSEKLTQPEKEFVKFFEKEFEIIKDFCTDFYECFLEKVGDYDKEVLKRVFKSFSLEDNEDDLTVLSLLDKNFDIFSLWLENATEIMNDNAFYYLAWNNLLPERFKDDERYETAIKILKEYKAPVFDLKTIQEREQNTNLIIYMQEYLDKDNFIQNYVDDKKFVPCLFWYTYEDEKWTKMDQETAFEILDDESGHNNPYLHLSFILEGYKLPIDTIDKLCDNDVILILQTYFKMHHAK